MIYQKHHIYVLLASFGMTACQESTWNEQVEPIDEENNPMDIIYPISDMYLLSLADFQHSNTILFDSILSWSALGEPAKENVKTDWLETVEIWQSVHSIRIGPYNPYLYNDHFEDIQIYSWPLNNPCLVDMITLSQEFYEDDFFEQTLATVHGLDTLEHLIFAGEELSCPTFVEGESPESRRFAEEDWAALSSEEIDSRRAEYARILTLQIGREAQEIRSVWNTYIDSILAQVGEDTRPLDLVFNALYILETEIRTPKLKLPLLFTECLEAECSKKVESHTSRQGGRWLKPNLDTLKGVFIGGGGYGFDDILTHQGEEDLRDQIINSFDRSIVMAEDLNPDLTRQIIDDPTQVESLNHELIHLIELFTNDLNEVWDLEMYYHISED